MKRKLLIAIVSLATCISLLSCSAKPRKSSSEYKVVDEGDKIKIVTTIFPIYDFTKNIIGNDPDIELKLLIKSGIDMHSFNPSATDLKDIADCDLFVYVGGESDEWVDKAIGSGLNKSMKTLNLMETLPDILVEEDEGDDEHEAHTDDIEYDEHIWLSLKNARAIVKAIKNIMIDISPDKKEEFDYNERLYLAQVDALDEEYKKVRSEAKKDALVFADRFPFKYLCDDYDIKYFAAFNGCSAESEASFEKITSLAKKVDEYNLDYVLTLEGNNQKIARTVIENTEKKNAKITTLDSMQSINEKDIEDGANYIDIMIENLGNLALCLR